MGRFRVRLGLGFGLDLPDMVQLLFIPGFHATCSPVSRVNNACECWDMCGPNPGSGALGRLRQTSETSDISVSPVRHGDGQWSDD